MTEPNDLLDAVDALTKERHENVPIFDDYGVYAHPVYVRTHTTSSPPLLQWLADAVNPSTNTAAGSSSLASTRNLIDGTALHESARMSSAIGDWCRMVGVERTRNPITDLRRWYLAYTVGDNDPTWYVHELRRWAGLIRGMMEPPKRMEITAPCPVCGKRVYADQDGSELLFPVVVEYRIPVDDEPIRPTARCRNMDCLTVWEGYDSVAELAEEITGQKEEER